MMNLENDRSGMILWSVAVFLKKKTHTPQDSKILAILISINNDSPTTQKQKTNVWKKEPHKTGHPQTTKQNTKNPGCFSWRFFRVQGFPFLPAASSSGWMRSCGELAVLGTQHETVGCGNSYQVHTWKCNSWDGSAVGHVLFHYIIYIHMFSCVYICVSIYRERLSVLYIPRWYRISAVNRNSSRLLEPSEKRFAQLVVEFTQLKKLWVNLDHFLK